MAASHFKEAVALAEKAAALDDSDAEVHSLLSYVRLFERKYDDAISEGARAVELDPNNVHSHSLLAHAMLFAGDFNGAIRSFHRALRLSPYSHDWDLLNLGNAYFMSKKYKEAIDAWKRHHTLLKKQGLSERRFIVGHIGLAASYKRLGQESLARKHAKEVLRLNPNFRLSNMQRLNPYKDPNHFENIMSALREAGLK
jgi:tetratricopeptide (TPR) repeat protein